MKRFVLGLGLSLILVGACHADYVTGLNPYGDNYLSLRTGPGTHYTEIDRMGPGTRLEVIGRSGSWRHVRLENGEEGWAFGKYIARGEPQSDFPGDEEQLADDATAPEGDPESDAETDGLNDSPPSPFKTKPKKVPPNGMQTDPDDLE